MNYTDIRPAGASECSAGVGVEKKLTISVSKLFGASASFVRGDRHKSITSRKEPYHGKVNTARRLPVLFYDRARKRGWLVDGASALLHIARSQVVHPLYRESSHFNDTAVNSVSFKHPKAEDSPDAASEMLKDHDNQRHIINSEFGGYEQGKTDVYGRPQSFQKYNFFKQLISDTWDTFDQIYSQQDQAKRSQTQQLRIPDSSIEGYEYMDLVSLRSPLTRRYIKLHSNGSEWSSFIRKINAITLFGQHFGELYTPGRNDERHICAHCRTVPTGLEYLAVPIPLLKELNKHSSEDGKIGPGSLEIAKNVTWAPSEGVFFDGALQRDVRSVPTSSKTACRDSRLSASANHPGAPLARTTFSQQVTVLSYSAAAAPPMTAYIIRAPQHHSVTQRVVVLMQEVTVALSQRKPASPGCLQPRMEGRARPSRARHAAVKSCLHQHGDRVMVRCRLCPRPTTVGRSTVPQLFFFF